MKTTIELSDGLLAEAKRIAKRDGTTLKALVEQGLHRTIEERKTRRAFTLRDAAVNGQGVSPDLRESGWEAIRDLAYREHGA